MLTKPYFGKLFFEADSGSNAGNSGSESDSGKDAQPGGQQGEPEGFKPIQSEAELAAWKGSTRKAILEEVRADLKREREAEDAKAEDERKRQAEIDKGNFDTVKTELETKATEAEGRATTAETERDAAYALLEAQATALQEELPKELLDDFPADGSPVERIKWLQQQKKVFDIAKAATGANGQHPRVPATPAAQGNVKPDIRENLKTSGIRYT